MTQQTDEVDLSIQGLAERLAAEAGGGTLDAARVVVEESGSIAVLRAADWCAWVLAVLPTATDSLLVAASEMRARCGLPMVEQVLPIDWDSASGGSPAPQSAPEVRTIVVDVDAEHRALTWLALSPGERAIGELTGLARVAAPEIRRHLPGSASLGVAMLRGGARTLFERAARVSMTAAVTGEVGVAHMAAALLTDPDLTSIQAIEGPWPEPDEAARTVLATLGRGADAEATARSRVAQLLAAGRVQLPAQRQVANVLDDDLGWEHAFLAGVLRRALPGIRLVGTPAAEAAGDGAECAVELGLNTDKSDPTEVRSPIGIAAIEVATHLARTDTQAVILAGPHEAAVGVLARIARLGAHGIAPVLVDRHLLLVDGARLTRPSEEQLGWALTYHPGQLAIAVRNPTSQAALSLLRTAAAASIPVMLLVSPTRGLDPELGAPPVVRIPSGPPQPTETVADLLQPIATQLARIHGVTLAPGVVGVAAAPLTVDPAEDDPFLEILDASERPEPNEPPDPAALGSARLDYACARASLRPDRVVRPHDVPTDPSQGLSAGSAAPHHGPGTTFTAALNERIVDQPDAVATVDQRLRFAARGLRRTGPRASLLLAGPPGTGKTHTAGAIAEVYYGDPEALIRIDCGVLHERHTINSLLGAPPAYIGYDERERLLTTQITKRQGRCVILVDEIEKAEPRVMDILLGVLDTGQLVDLQQHRADATQAIFVLTSNLGSDRFTRHRTGFIPPGQPHLAAAVLAEVRNQLRPELLDRIDDVVVYRPLTRAGIAALTTRQLAALTRSLRVEGYDLDIPVEIASQLADHVEAIGVRGLRRYLETAILRDLLTLPPGRFRARMAGSRIGWGRSGDEVP